MPYERKTEDILISEDLRRILSKIEKQSQVAAMLLRKRHEKETLVEDHVNYLSVSSDDPTKISYLTKERQETIDEDSYWTSKRRYHTKPGALVTKLFSGVPAKEVENFSTLFRNAGSSDSYRFCVVRGSRITYYYNGETYASDRGSLGSSCMKYEKCGEFLDLYAQNPDICSMLVMLDDNDRLLGRALLWQVGETKLMDRIYTVRDEKYRFHFMQWADENGHACKKSQNWFDTMNFIKDGQTKTMKLEISLPSHRFDSYPYMDTFKFYSSRNGKIYNYLPEFPVSVLCSAEGDCMDGDYLVLDCVDNVYRYRNDAAYLHYINAWTATENAYYSDANGCWILKDHGGYDLVTGDYLFTGEYAHLNRKIQKESSLEPLPF